MMMSGRDERGAVASARYGRSGVGALCLRLRPIEGRSDTPLLSAARERVWPPVGCVTTRPGVRYSVVKSERELVSAKFGEIEAGRDKDLVWTAKQKPSILMNRSPPERSTEMEWLTDSN